MVRVSKKNSSSSSSSSSSISISSTARVSRNSWFLSLCYRFLGNKTAMILLATNIFSFLYIVRIENECYSSSSWIQVKHYGDSSSSQQQQQQQQQQQLRSTTTSSAIVDDRSNKFSTSDPTCLQLSKSLLKPSGNFFPDIKNVHDETSLDDHQPQFHFGSRIQKDKAPYHIRDDYIMFDLIHEYLKQYHSKNGSSGIPAVAYDIGANQGFFTWYMASLTTATGTVDDVGLLDEVHSFEIDLKNFNALRHGHVYNTKEVSDRVNVYAIGLSDKVGRTGQAGQLYTGYLKPVSGIDVKSGHILSVTMDCFAYHNRVSLSPAVIKLDVEGFEISVLKGMKHSVLDKTNKNQQVGSLLVEVGPKRWIRSNVKFEDGAKEMQHLLEDHFTNSYIILRSKDKDCPAKLAKEAQLSDSSPRTLGGNKGAIMYKLSSTKEIKNLLSNMLKRGSDCNFWFTN